MVILQRLLTYASAQGDIDVDIIIRSPVQGEHDWSCAYEISWPGEARRGFGYGVDSTQSVMLALQGIGTDIYTSDYHRSGRLRWEKSAGGYGYPVPQTIRHLLVGDDIAISR